MSEPRVLIIDDEPLVARSFAAYLREGVSPAPRVEHLLRPSQLTGFDLSGVSHAVIDLSFGRTGFGRFRGGRENRESGVDAVDLLRGQGRGAPRLVVASRLDTDLHEEMAIAIRQSWPEISFLHKADARIGERVVDFVTTGRAEDNAAFSLLLIGVRSVTLDELARFFAALPFTGAALEVLTELAERVEPPSFGTLSRSCGLTLNYTRRVVQETSAFLRYEGFMRDDLPSGLHRLWPWSRARRPLLDRVRKVLGA